MLQPNYMRVNKQHADNKWCNHSCNMQASQNKYINNHAQHTDFRSRQC